MSVRHGSSVQAKGNVFEIRPIDDFRVCAHCLVVNSALDARCSACRAELAVPHSSKSGA